MTPTQPTVEEVADVVRALEDASRFLYDDGARIASEDIVIGVRKAIALLSALEKDALRYRWLRDESNTDCDVLIRSNDENEREWLRLLETELDTAIDLARGAT